MINFAALPTDQPYSNNIGNEILDQMLGAYKNSLAQKDMQKQKSMQEAMQYAQPFGNEQELMQNQMKMLQSYSPPNVPEVNIPEMPSLTLPEIKANKEAEQAAALDKYLNGPQDQSQQTQPTTDTMTQKGQPVSTNPYGEIPPQPSLQPNINYNNKYAQASPNPMLMNGGQPEGVVSQAQSAQLTNQGINNQVQPSSQRAMQSANNYQPQEQSQDITGQKWAEPRWQAIDNAWLKNPQAVESKFGLKGSTKTYPNLSNGQMIEETTFPSGKKTYNVQQVTTPSNGTTVFDPTTGKPLVQMGGGGAAGQINSKQGEGVFYKTDDEGNVVLDKNTGKPIPQGTLTPLTQQERDEQGGRSMFSDIYPLVNEAQTDYSGKGSIKLFTSDVNYVEKHPDEDSPQKRRLVNFKVSENLLNPLAVKEQSTLGASGTLGMFNALQSTLGKSDIPKVFKLYESYKVPGIVNKEAGEKFLQIITDATTKANEQTPAFQKRYYNIEDQQADKQRALAKASKQISLEDPFAQYKVGQ